MKRYVFDLDEMFRRMSDTFKELQNMQSEFESGLSKEFPVDVEEEGDKIIVKADLPGVEKENINLKAAGNELMISAESKKEVHEENEKYVRKERSARKFSRRISLPAEVKTGDIEAKYKNGVLKVVLPKKEKKKKKEIKVK